MATSALPVLLGELEVHSEGVVTHYQLPFGLLPEEQINAALPQQLALSRQSHLLMIAQGYLSNQGDAWDWTQNTLERAIRDQMEPASTEQEAHTDALAELTAMPSTCSPNTVTPSTVTARLWSTTCSNSAKGCNSMSTISRAKPRAGC
ncbi:hypothetical protein WR25_24285 [Diploscapter pachys]|uniref:Uncharacterized protein n=1 Tax=Diploscapter pachys TaxID=2018661 RepID=A0A2A2KE57_9BILA|nr:hypothetical protein WR25_24285 [Diploscapter pachys]